MTIYVRGNNNASYSLIVVILHMHHHHRRTFRFPPSLRPLCCVMCFLCRVRMYFISTNTTCRKRTQEITQTKANESAHLQHTTTRARGGALSLSLSLSLKCRP